MCDAGCMWWLMRWDRWRPVAVHAAAAAGIQGRVLRRRWRLHLRTGNVQRVLQSATSLDSEHAGQHDGPHVRLPSHRHGQRQHLLPVHDVSGGGDGSQYAGSCDCSADGCWCDTRGRRRWIVLAVASDVLGRRCLLHACLLQVQYAVPSPRTLLIQLCKILWFSYSRWNYRHVQY